MEQIEKDTLENLLYKLQEETESEEDKESISSIIELVEGLN